MSKTSALLVGFALAAASIAAALVATAQPTAPQSTSLFPNSTDIGVTQPGATTYRPVTQTYELTGGGADMWGGADAFRFAWTRVSGDASLTATVVFPPGNHPPNEKAVLIFRQSLDPGSPYADIAIHADGHITLQYRLMRGGPTADVTAAIRNAKTLSITRHGDSFTASVSGPGGQLADFAHIDIPLQDPIYAGLGVCSHDANGLVTVTFSSIYFSRSPIHP
jgi:hypothetical protein